MTEEDLNQETDFLDVYRQRGLIKDCSIEWLDEQWNEAMKKQKQRSEAGRRSGQARRKKKENDTSTSVQRAFNERSTNDQQAFNVPSTGVEQIVEQKEREKERKKEIPPNPLEGEMVSSSQNNHVIQPTETISNATKQTEGNSSVNVGAYPDQFETLWKKLPVRPGSKQKAFRSWKKLNTAERAICNNEIQEFYELEIKEAESTSRSETHVSTAINSKFWENMEDKRRSAGKVVSMFQKADEEDPLVKMHQEIERHKQVLKKQREESRRASNE